MRVEFTDEIKERLTGLLVEGLSKREIAEQLGCSEDSAQRWSKREDVAKSVEHALRVQANEFLRQIDTVLLARLREGGKDISTEVLIRLRAQYAPKNAAADPAVANPEAAGLELFIKAMENPEAAAALGLGAGGSAGETRSEDEPVPPDEEQAPEAERLPDPELPRDEIDAL